MRYPKQYRSHGNYLNADYKIIVETKGVIEYDFVADLNVLWIEEHEAYIVIDRSGNVVKEKNSFRLMVRLINQKFHKLPLRIRRRARFIATMDDLKPF